MPSARDVWWHWQSAVQGFGGLAASPAPGWAQMNSLTLRFGATPYVSSRMERFCCVRGIQASASCLAELMHPTAPWLLRGNSCMPVKQKSSKKEKYPLPETVYVWDRGSRFPLNGSVYHSNAEAWQISRGRVSEVRNQTLPEPWGSSFWENSEQSGPNPRKTLIPSGRKPNKMFTPALLHKMKVLVLFSCQCSGLLAWKSWWRRSSASLLSHVSFVSRVVVIMGTSSKSAETKGEIKHSCA